MRLSVLSFAFLLAGTAAVAGCGDSQMGSGGAGGSGGSLMGMGAVRFSTYKEPGSVTDHANLIFFGPAYFRIPTGIQNVGPSFLAPRNEIKVFGLTTHTHRLGIDAKIELAQDKSTP